MQPYERVLARTRPAGECLEWTGTVAASGYGYLVVGSRTDGTRRKVGVHRLALEHRLGRPIPAGLYALHTCDNKSCVLGEHLRAGTHAENMADRERRGRTARGSRVGGARWAERDVLEARGLVQAGAPLGEVAARFGVSKATVSRAVRGVTWACT